MDRSRGWRKDEVDDGDGGGRVGGEVRKWCFSCEVLEIWKRNGRDDVRGIQYLVVCQP